VEGARQICPVAPAVEMIMSADKPAPGGTR
jgi:hypothetical protein